MKPHGEVLVLELTFDSGTGEIFAPAIGRQGVREVGFVTGPEDEGNALGAMFAAAPALCREVDELASDLDVWATMPDMPVSIRSALLKRATKAREVLKKAGVL